MARPMEMRRARPGDCRTTRVAWSMDQVSPSMPSSSANSIVWRSDAWKRKELIPSTKREMDMKSNFGEKRPRDPGPYMERSARTTDDGRRDVRLSIVEACPGGDMSEHHPDDVP